MSSAFVGFWIPGLVSPFVAPVKPSEDLSSSTFLVSASYSRCSASSQDPSTPAGTHRINRSRLSPSPGRGPKIPACCARRCSPRSFSKVCSCSRVASTMRSSPCRSAGDAILAVEHARVQHPQDVPVGFHALRCLRVEALRHIFRALHGSCDPGDERGDRLVLSWRDHVYLAPHFAVEVHPRDNRTLYVRPSACRAGRRPGMLPG